MTEDGKPTFVGSQQDIDLAGRVFELMLMQGRFYSGDSPITQSLRQMSAYFVEQGLAKDADELGRQLDQALTVNSMVFYREQREDDIYFVTTKKGAYRPQVRVRSGVLPVITERHMVGAGAAKIAAAPLKRPQFVSHEASQISDLQQLLKSQHTSPLSPLLREPVPAAVQPKEKRAERPAAAAPVAPPPVKRVPQVETPQGVMINLSKSPVEILAKQRDFFTSLLRELVADERFVNFGNDWMLAEQVTQLAKGELRQVREFIEASGGPETDESLTTNVFNKAPETNAAFQFSLNYQLAAEKRVFEFVGTAAQNLWGVTGATSQRIVTRRSLKPAEIGQDFKFLEDEAPVLKLPNGKWVHILTFYEWENGILPYSPEAKVLFPPALLKEQRIAQLRFEAPQFETSAYVELHYPTGNRGGWIEGLGEILAVFVSGAKLVIARNPDKPDTFSIQYESKAVQETNVLLHDTKRNRFVFQPLPLSYQTDEGYLLERQRYAGMKDARRLDDANRRKGDAVIIFAFEKIGVKATVEEKTVYRARLEDLLPIINIEKPFSKASLLRFFTTHPHYQKDEAEEGYYTYTAD